MATNGGQSKRRTVPSWIWAALAALLLIGAATVPAGAIDAGSNRSGVRALEPDLDRTFDVVRVFERWDSVFPDAEERLYLSEGRTLLLSIFPQRTNGELIPWADIATAAPGSELYEDIVRWANRIAPYQDQVYVSFAHEPEAVKNIPLGTSADFQAAWTNIMNVFDTEGLATLGRVFIVTSSAWDYDPADPRAFEHWYPGPDTVDAVGGDAYNFVDCRPLEATAWASLAEIIEGQRAWGVANPTMPLMLPEFASIADPADPDRRAQWFRDARATLTDPAYGQFTLVSYFASFDAANPDCDYLSFGDAERQAFYDLMNDPGLGGTPTPGAAPTSCTAFVDPAGTDVVVDWQPAYEAVGYRLERTVGGVTDVATEGPVLSFTEVDAGATYAVSSVAADGAVSTPTLCVDPGPEPPPLLPPSTCEWARDEGFITVSWLAADQATEYVVYRSVNGSPDYWRGRTAETELADSDLFANLVYSVRSRAIDGTLSAASTTCADTSPPIPAPSAPPDCSFIRNGTTIDITWTPGTNSTSTIIERTVNGNGPYWRTRTANTTFTDTDRTGTITYQATAKNDADLESAPTPCTDLTPPPAPLGAPADCSFIRNGTTIDITWTPGTNSTSTIIERTVDGNGPYWRTRTTNTTFSDTDRTGTITYQATAKNDADLESTPTPCTDLTPAP